VVADRSLRRAVPATRHRSHRGARFAGRHPRRRRPPDRPAMQQPGTGDHCEAHVPTQQPSAGSQARVPGADVHPGRAGDHQEPSPQGPPAPVGLSGPLTAQRGAPDRGRPARRGRLAPVRGRTTFAQLSRGRRYRGRHCTLVVGPEQAEPSVSFAIGRKVGTAVQRNLVRRRLRVVLSEARSDGTLSNRAHLVIVHPGAATAPFGTLRDELIDLLRRPRGRGSDVQ
jgi:ribonuclease P protein component